MQGLGLSAFTRSVTIAALSTLLSGPVLAQSGPTTLKVVERGSYSNAPIYVADSQGFFAEQGIKIEIVNLGGQSDTLTAALTRGDIDILPQNPIAFANALGKVDMKYFLGIQLDDIELVVKKSDDKVPNAAGGGWQKTVSALKGYKLGSATRGSTTFAKLAAMLTDIGYTADKDYSVVVSGIVNQSVAAMKANQVDAFITDSFGARVAEQQGVGKSVLVWATDHPPKYNIGIQTALAARGSALTNQRAIYESFGKAMVKANDWIRDPANHDKLAALIERQYKLEPATAADLATRTQKTGVFDARLTPKLFKDTMDSIATTGAVPGKLPSYDESVTKLSLSNVYSERDSK